MMYGEEMAQLPPSPATQLGCCRQQMPHLMCSLMGILELNGEGLSVYTQEPVPAQGQNGACHEGGRNEPDPFRGWPQSWAQTLCDLRQVTQTD